MVVPKEHPEIFRVLFCLFTTSAGCVPGFLPFLGARAGSSDEKAVVGADEPLNKDPAIEAFYASWAWRKCRESFMASRGWLCEKCLAKGLIKPAVEAHHKVPITPENLDDPSVTLNHANLMALCEECHTAQHRTKRWRCDALGRVIL